MATTELIIDGSYQFSEPSPRRRSTSHVTRSRPQAFTSRSKPAGARRGCCWCQAEAPPTPAARLPCCDSRSRIDRRPVPGGNARAEQADKDAGRCCLAAVGSPGSLAAASASARGGRHGLRATHTQSAAASAGPAASGRHSDTLTSPGSTSSSPAKKRAT
jgi:hypothetical protein